jgi:hypothetical protein
LGDPGNFLKVKKIHNHNTMNKKKVSNMIKKVTILLALSMIYHHGISQHCSDTCSDKKQGKKEASCSKKEQKCSQGLGDSAEGQIQSCSFSQCLICPGHNCSACPACAQKEKRCQEGICITDLNGDEQITVLDLLIFLEEFEKKKQEPKACCNQ